MKKPEKFITVKNLVKTYSYETVSKKELMAIDFDEVFINGDEYHCDLELLKVETIENKDYGKQLAQYHSHLEKEKKKKLDARERRLKEYHKLKKEFESDTN